MIKKKTKSDFIINYKNHLESFHLFKIMEITKDICYSRPKMTIRDYINSTRFKKEKKVEIENDIIKSLFGVVLRLIGMNEEKSLNRFLEYIRYDFTGYGKLNSILTKMASPELFGKFLFDVAQKADKTEGYGELINSLCGEIQKFPDKKLLSTFVDFMLKMVSENKIDQVGLKRTIYFLSKKKLLQATFILLLEHIYATINKDKLRQKRILLAEVELLDQVLNCSDKSIYLALTIAYVGGLFIAVPELQNLESKIKDKFLKVDYLRLIELSMKNIHKYLIEKKTIKSEYEKRLEKEKVEMTKYWNNKYEVKIMELSEYLSEIYSRLLQIRSDVETQNISENTNLFKRIIATERYINGILPILGVHLIGKKNEITRFDINIHQCLGKMDKTDIFKIDNVKILIPGFKFMVRNRVRKVIKKAIVEPVEIKEGR